MLHDSQITAPGEPGYDRGHFTARRRVATTRAGSAHVLERTARKDGSRLDVVRGKQALGDALDLAARLRVLDRDP